MYQAKLDKMIDDMNASILYFVQAAYRKTPPVMAMDLDPAEAMRRALEKLIKRWQGRFDDAADKLGEYFATSVSKRTDAALKAILKKAGFSVEFKLTKAQRDVLQATVNQNVSLIKSIPEQYLAQVEGSVMRAVQTGMDVGGLAKELRGHFGVTKRRAALISKTQNIMATSAFNRVRQTELGITEAEWHHSSAGKEPRPTHVKAGRDKVIYDVNKGWFDPAVQRYIQPGELINCRCTSRSIIPGFI